MTLLDWIILILLVLWLTGNLVLPVFGNAIHILLFIALLVIVYRLAKGQPPLP